MVKRALPWKVWKKDGGTEWRAERLKKPKPFHGVYTDAQPVRFGRDGRTKLQLTLTHGGRQGNRRDLQVAVNRKREYWHRVVGFAYSPKPHYFEGLGGAKVRFSEAFGEAFSWDAFVRSKLQVDHGERGTGFVLIDDLRLCTAERNRELEKERTAAKEAAKEAAREVAVQRRKAARKRKG